MKRARKALNKYDKLRADLRAAENEVSMLCREYDMATGSRGIRIESLRYSVDMRTGRAA